MNSLEFAKLIARGKDFDIKSFRFGDCRVINGVEYIVLYDDAKAPAVEIARWRKECIWHYLDFITNPNKRGDLSSAESLAIDDERSTLERIYSFIGVEKGNTGDANVDREQFVGFRRIVSLYDKKRELADKISLIQHKMNDKINKSFVERFGFSKEMDLSVYSRVLYMYPLDRSDVSWYLVNFCDWTIYFYYNSSENNGKKYKIPQKDIKDWFRDLNIEKMEVQNGIDC